MFVKKYLIIVNVVSPIKRKRIELIYGNWVIKTKLDIYLILKWEIIKKCKYKIDDRFCQLCMEE